jgi:allantoinase
MPLDKSYLEYPHRSYGMDHDRYDWSMLTDRKDVNWPNGKKLALWVNVSLQFFPLDQKGVPVKPQGGMIMPYPDLRH